MNNTNFKENLLEFRDLLKGFLPKGRIEGLLFLGFVVFYLLLSISVVCQTSIIEGDGVFFFDLYFTFDNPLIFRQGYFASYDVAHPLIRYINRPYMFVGELLSLYGGVKAKTILTVILCSATISLSIVYVYRYLKVVINIDMFVAILLSVFYGVFTTNIILSFTPESYTLTAFLLTYCIYYYSYSIEQGKKLLFYLICFFHLDLAE